MLKKLAHKILQDRYLAMGIALLCALLPFFGWIGIVLMAFVTLRQGIVRGGWIFIALLLPVGVWWFHHPSPVAYAIVLNYGLVYLLAILLRETNSFTRTMCFVSVIAAIIIVGMHLTHPQLTDARQAIFSSVLTQAHQEGMLANLDNAQLAMLVVIAARIGAGIQATLILMQAIVLLIMARAWQAAVFNPGGLNIALRSIRLEPAYIGILLLWSLAAAYGIAAAIDGLVPLFLPCLAAGLSVISVWFSRVAVKRRWLWWLVFVGALVGLTFPLMVALVLLGILDTWLDVRGRTHANT